MSEEVLIQLPSLEVRRSDHHGYGVFTREAIPAGTVVEECLALGGQMWELGPFNSALTSYTYAVGEQEGRKSFVAFGYGSIYNHSHQPNLNGQWQERDGRMILVLTATRLITSGEELRHNYGAGYWLAQASQAAAQLSALQAKPGAEDESDPERAAARSFLQFCVEESGRIRGKRERHLEVTAVEKVGQRFAENVRATDQRVGRLESKIKRKRKILKDTRTRLARTLEAPGAEATPLSKAVAALRSKGGGGAGGSVPLPYWQLGAGSVGRDGMTFDDQELCWTAPAADTIVLQTGDLVLALSGASKGRIGSVPARSGNLVADNTLLVLRPEPEIVDSDFLWQWLRLGSVLDGVFDGEEPLDIALAVLQREVPIPSLDKQRRCLDALATAEVRLGPLHARALYELRASELALQDLMRSREAFADLRDTALAVLRPFIDINVAAESE